MILTFDELEKLIEGKTIFWENRQIMLEEIDIGLLHDLLSAKISEALKK